MRKKCESCGRFLPHPLLKNYKLIKRKPSEAKRVWKKREEDL